MYLFVAVTKNSVSSWAILHVVALASTPKTGTVLHGGLSHESLVFGWLFVGCLLRDRA